MCVPRRLSRGRAGLGGEGGRGRGGCTTANTWRAYNGAMADRGQRDGQNGHPIVNNKRTGRRDAIPPRQPSTRGEKARTTTAALPEFKDRQCNTTQSGPMGSTGDTAWLSVVLPDPRTSLPSPMPRPVPQGTGGGGDARRTLHAKSGTSKGTDEAEKHPPTPHSLHHQQHSEET